jgi:hypothetical protein
VTCECGHKKADHGHQGCLCHDEAFRFCRCDVFHAVPDLVRCRNCDGLEDETEVSHGVCRGCQSDWEREHAP